jgi:glyoxylase-like metal-dependent hydrolase (beta-lactamase superfamily II)
LSLKSKTAVRITKPFENVTCILAPNPGPMTYRGTNTYIIGDNELAIIDPGPLIDEHFDNILKVIDERPVKFIFLTHSHIDHSPLAKQLSNKLGTQIFAFGPSDSGLSKVMLLLIAEGYKSLAEGIDNEFIPDHFIKDGDKFILGNKNIKVIYTPGHMGNHVCFQYDEILFSGDHVMDWATSMVSPPYGDLTQFMASCRMLQTKQFDLFLPGHGEPVRNPSERLNFIISHRLDREEQIISTIKNTPMTAIEITKIIYTEIDQRLIPAATRNVFAHLIDLKERGIVEFNGAISEKSKALKL